jgi:hypothetical protein
MSNVFGLCFQYQIYSELQVSTKVIKNLMYLLCFDDIVGKGVLTTDCDFPTTCVQGALYNKHGDISTGILKVTRCIIVNILDFNSMFRMKELLNLLAQ